MVAGFGADNFPVEPLLVSPDGTVLERKLLAPPADALLPQVAAFDPNVAGEPPDWLWFGSVEEV